MTGPQEADGDRLERYRAKRAFDRTPEPSGAEAPASASASASLSASAPAPGDGTDPRFVVQKHDARRLHYDFRLEAEGVLVSWAVPKGPSYDPGTKRLAVHVEDHPLDYRGFEGVIPGAEYGAGTVIVWDEGTYRNLTQRQGRPVEVADAVRRGHVSVWLEGTKLRGGWSLTRTGGSVGKEAWILVKRSDDHADAGRDVTATEPGSVRTGRTLADIEAERDGPAPDRPAASSPSAGAAGDPAPLSPPAGAAATAGPDVAEASAAAGGAAPDALEGAATREPAVWLAPMLAQQAKSAERLQSDRTHDWRFERKLDGLRCVAVRNGDRVELWSRNHLSFNGRFPEVVAALGRIGADNFTIDGEIVAFDGDRTSFARLQGGDRSTRPVYCAFDLLHLLGRDTTALALPQRQALLAQALQGAPEAVTTVAGVEGEPGALLRQACADGWEGLIAKRVTAPYRSGRSSDWQKLKCSAGQELVIAGWTDPSGTRLGFGALLVGYYDEEGGLRYAGKVGTGFDDKSLPALPVGWPAGARAASPFAEPVMVKGAHWVEPDLVGAVSFTEWTADGRLRHPSFQALRPDKEARAVRRETPASAPAPRRR